MKHPKVFLKEVQDSEHHIKMRWLVIFAAIAMALVLLLWVVYFGLAVRIDGPRTSNPASATNP